MLAGLVISILFAQLRALSASDLVMLPGALARPIDPGSAHLPPFMSTWPPPFEAMRYDAFAATSIEMRTIHGEPEEMTLPYNKGPLRASIVHATYGWPMRCLGHYWVGLQGESKAEKQAEFARQRAEVGWRLAPLFPSWLPFADRSGYRLIPTFVEPLGLVIDTAFWAAVVGAGATVVPFVRREHRRRRGHCGRCGYDVRGLGTCPECGSAVR